MERGHIKLWRKSIESGLLQNPNLWTFWCWCLMKASWKEYQTIINYQVVNLMPGQFIFGRDSASNELGMSVRTIRTCVDKLKNMKNLTIKTTNKFSIISITNWGIYQGQRPTDDQQNDQQTTSKRPANDHKQEVKELKEIKENNIIYGEKTQTKPKQTKFTKPTIDEIRAYCFERKNNVNPERFYNHYESNGWMVGKNKMKNWKSAIITWECNDNTNTRSNGKKFTDEYYENGRITDPNKPNPLF